MYFVLGILAAQSIVIHGRDVALVSGVSEQSSSIFVDIALQSQGVHGRSMTVLGSLSQPLRFHVGGDF
jgi:hypothetical protein